METFASRNHFVKLRFSVFAVLLFLVIGGEVKGMNFLGFFPKDSPTQNRTSVNPFDQQTNDNLNSNFFDESLVTKKNQKATPLLTKEHRYLGITYGHLESTEIQSYFSKIFKENNTFASIVNWCLGRQVKGLENYSPVLKLCPWCTKNNTFQALKQNCYCNQCKNRFTLLTIKEDTIIFEKHPAHEISTGAQNALLLMKLTKNLNLHKDNTVPLGLCNFDGPYDYLKVPYPTKTRIASWLLQLTLLKAFFLPFFSSSDQGPNSNQASIPNLGIFTPFFGILKFFMCFIQALTNVSK